MYTHHSSLGDDNDVSKLYSLDPSTPCARGDYSERIRFDFGAFWIYDARENKRYRFLCSTV
jgi:hypothetical protein